MVSTIQIKPAPVLQPFVSWYALREFNTGEVSMPRPMHAVHEYYMTFFLKGQFCYIEDAEGKGSKHSNSLTALFTKPNGCCYWKGNYRVFCVQIKCNGLVAIFGIPQKLLLNTILSLNDFIGKDNTILSDLFESCKNIQQMGEIMNRYLIKKLLVQKHKAYTIIMAAISGEIIRAKGRAKLDQLSSRKYEF